MKKVIKYIESNDRILRFRIVELIQQVIKENHLFLFTPFNSNFSTDQIESHCSLSFLSS